MAELKTRPSNADVGQFLNTISDPVKQKDARVILQMMQDITAEKPILWGPGIIGFGELHYHYKSGREGDWFITGFSPRKQALTFYFMDGAENHSELLTRLGKHKRGVGCLYVKRLADIEMDVLRELITKSVAHQRKRLGQPAADE